MNDKAIEVYKRIIKKDSTNIRAHWNLAVIYFGKGLFKEAIIECNHILKIDPDSTSVRQMLEAILIKKGVEVK